MNCSHPPILFSIPRSGALLAALNPYIKPRPRKTLPSPTHLFAHYQNARIIILCLCLPKSPHSYGMLLFFEIAAANAMAAVSWLCCRYKATVANLPSFFNDLCSSDQILTRIFACLFLQTWSLCPTCSCLLKQKGNRQCGALLAVLSI